MARRVAETANRARPRAPGPASTMQSTARMKSCLSLLLLFASACTDEPDLLDEILQDLEPTMPDYGGKADGATLEQLGAVHCPGIALTGATTYRGVTGTYWRIGAPALNEPLRLTFVAERDDGDARGTFTGTRSNAAGLPELYAGRFGMIGDNPAIGAALSLDVGANGEYDDFYFVLGVRHAYGRVRALCLAGAERPFMMLRTY